MKRRSALFVLSCVLPCALACEAGTGGGRALFEMSLAGTPGAASTFRTSLGWDVALEQACISIGPVYLYANPAESLALQPAPGPFRRVAPQPAAPSAAWVSPFLGVAHAHPGLDHFNGGEVRGEWLEQVALDALRATPVTLGTFEGIEGRVQSVTVSSHPLPSTLPSGAPGFACLNGHQAFVRGSASKDGRVVSFEGGLDIEASGNRRRFQVSTDLEIRERQQVAVTVDPVLWLDQVRFEDLEGDAGRGRQVIRPGSQASVAWLLGLQRSGAFRISAR